MRDIMVLDDAIQGQPLIIANEGALGALDQARISEEHSPTGPHPSAPEVAASPLRTLSTGLPLMAADIVAVGGSALVAALVIPAGLPASPILWMVYLSAAYLAAGAFFGLHPGVGLHPVIELRQSCLACVLLFWSLLAATVVGGVEYPSAWYLAATGVLAAVAVPCCRSIARNACSRLAWWGEPVLIFGDGPVGRSMFRYLSRHRQLGFRPIGIVDDLDRPKNLPDEHSIRYLGNFDHARELARRHRLQCAIIAMPERSAANVREVIRRSASNIKQLLVIPEAAGLPSLWSRPCDCAGLLGIEVKANLVRRVPRLVKWSIDLLLVIFGGLLALPLLAAIAALIKLASPGPVLYTHRRIGFGGRRFSVWKFRTMVVDAEAVLQKYLNSDPELRREWKQNQKLRNDPRITWIGRWLRWTSLDELPQLWNVLRGEMSLVGPRPIVDAEVSRYGDVYELYLKVRPGITGLWQVSGRNKTSYVERVRLDSYYVRNWSPWLDVYILAHTLHVVLRREGAY